MTYKWMEGGFFLIQRVELEQQDGQRITGIEVIGHERPFGAEPGEEMRSRFYSNTGDTLKIWAGERNSPAYFEGTFSDDRNTVTGRWEWPGGGHEVTMTRVEQAATKE